jgi:sodium/bile acid cotransporter 7
MQFLKRQWFLTCLAVILVLGFLFPRFFAPLAQAKVVRDSVVAAVLFLMALPLQTRQIGRSLRNPGVALLASAVNVGLLPLVAWGLAFFLEGDLRTGLFVIAAAPCTLASAAVWTRRAGGDETVALMVTVLTNASCFLITPLWLMLTTGTQVDLQESGAAKPGNMVFQLGLLVVLPMAMAQLLRQIDLIGRVAMQHKTLLSTVAQAGILTMVLVGATQCGLKLEGLNRLPLWDMGLMVLVVLALHLIVLNLGLAIAKALGISRPGQIAVGIAGSQKTLMVGIHIASSHFGGLTILPMVAYHVGQLVLDTIIADRLRKRSEQR